jgi:CheY-like chemotaxis protein
MPSKTRFALAVDDEPADLENVCLVLANAGYEVLMASDAKSAIELFQRHADHIEVLENVKRNRAGKLTVQNGVMQFEAGTTNSKVPTAAIDDLSIGSEATQAGGKAGTVARSAAIGAAYDSGAVLTFCCERR